MNKNALKNLTLSAMFLALGLMLPFLTLQIPELGKALLPMHIPVFICALICGWRYGLSVGLILPLLRCLLFGTPMFYPMALAMTVELATYGFVAGYLYSHSRWKCIIALYRSMIIAMIAGRLMLGISNIILMGVEGNVYTWKMFIAGAFTTAIPGIILQLILIPAIMVALNKAGLVKFHQHKGAVKAAV